MKRIMAILLALLLILTVPACAAEETAAPPPEEASGGFEDVADGAWYREAAAYVSEHGWMIGTSQTRFSPEDPFTRAQLATVLYRMAGEPETTAETGFTDTVPGSWYDKAVRWAKETGVVNGIGDGKFGPDDPVTQEQMAVMLWRMEDQPAAAAAGDASPYAAEAVGWIRESGILPPSPAVFTPAMTASRAMVASLLRGYDMREQETARSEILLTVAGQELTVSWADNSTVDALRDLLRQGEITLTLSDFGGFEKGGPLPETLPQNNEPMNTDAGDVILYQGRQFVIYYDQNSYSLTPLGRVTGMTKQELRDLLGTGEVTATLSLSDGGSQGS